MILSRRILLAASLAVVTASPAAQQVQSLERRSTISGGGRAPTVDGSAAATTTYGIGSVTYTTAATAAGSGTVTSVLAETTASGGRTLTLHSTKMDVLGTLESLASPVVHSDGTAVRPLDLSGAKFVGAWFALVTAVVYGAFAVGL